MRSFFRIWNASNSWKDLRCFTCPWSQLCFCGPWWSGFWILWISPPWSGAVPRWSSRALRFWRHFPVCICLVQKQWICLRSPCAWQTGRSWYWRFHPLVLQRVYSPWSPVWWPSVMRRAMQEIWKFMTWRLYSDSLCSIMWCLHRKIHAGKEKSAGGWSYCVPFSFWSEWSGSPFRQSFFSLCIRFFWKIKSF